MNYFKKAREFRTKKRLGQNFLIDENIINTIIEEADLSKNDTVIEIGPGVGFVTEKLAQKAGKVIAIEIDKSAIEELKKLNIENLEIINEDILKVNFENLTNEKIKVVANIPYYITSPIIAHLLGEIDELKNKNRTLISEVILMVQYEVAKRIVASEKNKSKDYGVLSVLSNFWADTEIIKKVPSKAFYPAPKVDSALVRFKVRETPAIEVANIKLFRKLIKAAFHLRRKNIKNALKNKGFSNAEEALTKGNIDINRRGESLSLEEFKLLTETFESLK